MSRVILQEFRSWWSDKLHQLTVPQGSCLIWRRVTDPDGYGIAHLPVKFRGLLGVSNTGKNRAHRLSCLLAHGEPSAKGLFAIHSCDNPSCVNPEHLQWGTAADNTSDMLAKARHKCAVGEAHGGARLTERDVINIRKMAVELTQKEIAARFDVAQSTISRIVSNAGKRKIWNHV